MSELRFSRSLYRLDAVERAAGAFAALGRFEVSADGADIRVTLDDLHPKLAGRREQILDEFRNRALYDTVLAARGDRGGAQ